MLKSDCPQSQPVEDSVTVSQEVGRHPSDRGKNYEL